MSELNKIIHLTIMALPLVVTGLWAYMLCIDAIEERRWLFAFIDFCAAVFVVQAMVAIVKVGAGK